MGGACSCCRAARVETDAECEITVTQDGRSFSCTGIEKPEDRSRRNVGSSKVAATPSAVKVAVLVRPLLDIERQRGAVQQLSALPPDMVSVPPRQGPSSGVNDGAYDFRFDRVYDASSTTAQHELFDDMVCKVLGRFCKGYNGTVLAYGQTGAGKTHTMGTAAAPSSLPSPTSGGGVVPAACAYVLRHAAAAGATYQVALKASYVEIYNEVIQDLLAPIGNGTGSPGATSFSMGTQPQRSASTLASSPDRIPRPTSACSTPRAAAAGCAVAAWESAEQQASWGGVVVREGPRGEVVLDGAAERRLTSMADVHALLAQGAAARATASHRMNAASSRSHAVLTLTLEQRAAPGAAARLPPQLRLLRSKLHLVDLAGSERAKDTGTSGQRFEEGVGINKGLLQLGIVINALSDAKARRAHVQYRNSKLTRLLADSLGGNSETLFIACVSPADVCRDHSLSTLRYASRAMSIKNSLRLAAPPTTEEELAALRAQLATLTAENEALRAQLAAVACGTAGSGSLQGCRAEMADGTLELARPAPVRVAAG